jgi:hexosaminidase
MIKQLSWRLSILASVLAAGAGSAAAQTYNCTSTLAAGSYTAVSVPANATCNVSTSGNVTVTGNVTVGSGATLQDFGTATFIVNSALLAVGSKMIYLVPATGGAVDILGSVSVTGATKTVDIRDSFVGGTLSVANSTISAYINLSGNNVAGNLLDTINHTPAAGDNDVDGNTIGASLVCTGNSPAPQDGGKPNTVGGSKVGQCSGL